MAVLICLKGQRLVFVSLCHLALHSQANRWARGLERFWEGEARTSGDVGMLQQVKIVPWVTLTLSCMGWLCWVFLSCIAVTVVTLWYSRWVKWCMMAWTALAGAKKLRGQNVVNETIASFESFAVEKSLTNSNILTQNCPDMLMGISIRPNIRKTFRSSWMERDRGLFCSTQSGETDRAIK